MGDGRSDVGGQEFAEAAEFVVGTFKFGRFRVLSVFLIFWLSDLINDRSATAYQD
jgi:hypothetical protein